MAKVGAGETCPKICRVKHNKKEMIAMGQKRTRWWQRAMEQLFRRKQSDERDVVGMPIRVRAAGGTDIGRRREQNEDAFLCLPERNVFIVADGMGGEAAGEVASKIAIEVLQAYLTDEAIEEALNSGPSLEPLYQTVLERANQTILETARSHPGWERMGTTVVVGVVRNGVIYLCNLGDSRAYLVRDGKASVLTRDHSTVMALVEAGYIRPEEARKHPLRNELTACLGMNKRLQPGYYALRLRSGDRIVLCSDGLWDMVSDEEIGHIVSKHEEPEKAVEELIAEANRAGGHDNITVIVILAETGEPKEGKEETLPESEGEVAEFARVRKNEEEEDNSEVWRLRLRRERKGE
ncbi:MAG: Stp1/IreP family PP2C-type Ser/Thr phosphatase [Armatimonadetes bacterium]|nr:Stp1/IreP family PP2C-type Ser/Thr phosphatase [Armatimonadota bacterium]